MVLVSRDRKVGDGGWSKLSRQDVIDMAQQFESDGGEAIIYTDIARGGMMQGVNIETTLRLAEAVNIPVIAAGGIHNLENLKKIAAGAGSGIIGALTGRAIYEGQLDFAEGPRAADEITGQGRCGHR